MTLLLKGKIGSAAFGGDEAFTLDAASGDGQFLNVPVVFDKLKLAKRAAAKLVCAALSVHQWDLQHRWWRTVTIQEENP